MLENLELRQRYGLAFRSTGIGGKALLASSWLARTLTIANSLTTKKPFSRTRKTIAKSLSKMIPGASQFVACIPTVSAILAKNGRVFIASGLGIVMLPKGPARSLLEDSRNARLPKEQRRFWTNEFFENGNSRGKYPRAGLRRCAR